MFEPSFSSANLRRSRIRNTIATGVAVIAMTVGAVAACSNDASTAPSGIRRVYGPAQPLGQGVARTFVALDAAGNPTTLGVALSESALNALPMTPLPGGGVAAATLMLALPQEAKVTGFNHAMVDWNPNGHEPELVYTLPHFDFHFYNIAEAAQMAMMPTDPQFNEKLEKMPAEQFRPVDNIKLPGGVPMMGAHWVDPSSPELLPPPNNQTFTRTFLYGSYDGHFVFYEPMITKAHIESLKTVPGNGITSLLKLPAKYEVPGYYPTKYSMQWDAEAKEYRIALDSLVQRNP